MTQSLVHPISTRFPSTRAFVGMNRSSRAELDVFELECEGAIPLELDGAFYRCGPDPQFPPMLGDDEYINGDGVVSMFAISKGHADLKARYVRTDKFLLERAARRALFGAYRNPYTDDPSVAGADRTTANTSVIYHGGRLFALKEDGLPHELDPDTLETIGKCSYGGALRSKTFTAHPKVDPATGELVFFGYAAKGDEVSTDISFASASASGDLQRETWFLPPYGSMIHDWCVNEHFGVFPVMPMTSDPARLANGGPRWAWDHTKTTEIGILPRGGDPGEARWFSGPPRWSFHTMNSFIDGDVVHLDLCVAMRAPFPDTEGRGFNRDEVGQYLTRWSCDLSSGNEWTEERLWDGMHVDFPMVDPRVLMRKQRHGFMAGRDFTKACPDELTVGVFFNTLAHIDFETGAVETHYVGEDGAVQEPIFVPRSPDAPEGDGFLMAVVDRLPFDRAELIILDTARFSEGPIARVLAPVFLRPTFHGTWVSAASRLSSKSGA